VLIDCVGADFHADNFIKRNRTAYRNRPASRALDEHDEAAPPPGPCGASLGRGAPSIVAMKAKSCAASAAMQKAATPGAKGRDERSSRRNRGGAELRTSAAMPAAATPVTAPTTSAMVTSNDRRFWYGISTDSRTVIIPSSIFACHFERESSAADASGAADSCRMHVFIASASTNKRQWKIISSVLGESGKGRGS
jgi:hypothetical protein